MSLTRTEFDILTGERKNYPRALVDKQLKIFRERGLLRDDKLTADGLKILGSVEKVNHEKSDKICLQKPLKGVSHGRQILSRINR